MSQSWECGVCWAVYDPAEGDPVWQIEPGTAFEALPEHWRCPRCDAPKEKFLAKMPAVAPPEPPVAQRLVAAYRAALPRMQGLPITNPRLDDVVASRSVPDAGGELVVVMTPWCLTAVWVPTEAAGEQGATVTRALPSGTYDFVVGNLEGVGQVWSLSLMSPVLEFDGPEAARVAVDAALEALLLPPAPAAAPPPPPSRRQLFGLRP